MKQVKFYLCSSNRSVMIDMGESSSQCRAEGLKLLDVHTRGTDEEKRVHIPLLRFEKNKLSVKVGEYPHPMNPDHYVEWVFVQLLNGCQLRKLLPGDRPEVSFPIENNDVLGVYTYCSLHGLWMAEGSNTTVFKEMF